jgi:hypothetical protein
MAFPSVNPVPDVGNTGGVEETAHDDGADLSPLSVGSHSDAESEDNPEEVQVAGKLS